MWSEPGSSDGNGTLNCVPNVYLVIGWIRVKHDHSSGKATQNQKVYYTQGQQNVTINEDFSLVSYMTTC